MAFTEDFSVFFSEQGFAIPASRTAAGGGAATTGSIILDLTDIEADGLIVEGPSMAVPATTWPTLAQGDSITANATTFTVRAVIGVSDGAILRVQLARV
jgi:hypothetical protein